MPKLRTPALDGFAMPVNLVLKLLSLVLLTVPAVAACDDDESGTSPQGLYSEVRFDPASVTLRVGRLARITPELVRTDGTVVDPYQAGVEITWASDNPDVAVVGEFGGVLAVAPGQTAVRVTAAGLTATVPVEVEPMPAEIRITNEVVRAPAGSVIPGGVGVRLTDAAGRPTPGVTVRFTVLTGGGSVEPAESETGKDGFASTLWTLGSEAGPQALQVEAIGEATTATAPVGASDGPAPSALSTASATEEVLLSTVVVAEAQPAPPHHVNVTPGVASLAAGGTRHFSATVVDEFGNPAPRQGVVWASSDQSVATVDLSGHAVGHEPGEATITATYTENGGVQGSAKVTVSAGQPNRIVVVSGSEQVEEVGAELPQPLVVAVVDAGGNPVGDVQVNWEIPSGAGTLSSEVTSTGADGRTSVTWNLSNKAGEHEVTAEVNQLGEVTFTATATAGPIVDLAIDPSVVLIIELAELQLTALGLDQFGNVAPVTASWTALDPSVATVSSTGLLAGVAKGTTLIRAEKDELVAEATVNVVESGPPASLSVNPPTASIPAGTTQLFVADVRDSGGNTVPTTGILTWTSSNPGVATVDAAGLATGVSAGTTTITATAVGGVSNTSTLTVTAAAPRGPASISVSPTAATLTPGTNRQLSATVRDASGAIVPGVPVTWTSSATGVATVNASGRVTGVADGVAQVTARTPGGLTATAVITVSVTPLNGGPNEPAGLAPIIIRPFNTINDGTNGRGSGPFPSKLGGSEGWDDVERRYSALRLASDPAAPLSPASVLEMEYTAGPVAAGTTYSPGVAQTQTFTGSAHGALQLRTLYVQTAFKISSNWENHPTGTKLFFFRSNDVAVGGSLLRFEPYLALLGAGPPYTLAANFQGAQDNTLGFFQVAPNSIQTDTWYTLECELRMNSAFGVPDGVFRCWVNGTLGLERLDVSYIPANDPGPWVWDQIHVAPTWGGQGGNKTETFFLWVDHFYVSGAS